MEDLERGIQIVGGGSGAQYVATQILKITSKRKEKEFMIRSMDYVIPELFLKKSKNKPVYGNSYVKRKFR